MSKKTVLVIIGAGVEEIEAVSSVDVLRRAGVECTIASRESRRLVEGRNGIRLEADTLLDDVAERTFDCILVPGGPGTAAMRKDPRVLKLVREHRSQEKLIGAICAAPTVLKDAEILPGPHHTGHASILEELPDLDQTQAVVVDGNLITSRGAGTAVDFGLALAAALAGQEKADEVAASIHFH